MGGKTAIAAGLVMGIVVGGALMGGVVLLAPGLEPLDSAPTPGPTSEGVAPTSSASSAPAASPSPVASSPGASGSAAPSALPSAGGSPSALPSPAGSPSAASDGLFGVGKPTPALHVPRVGGGVILDADGAAQAAWKAIALPVHFWVDTDGVVRYGALGGIGPDVMATGLQTILPGVTVTP